MWKKSGWLEVDLGVQKTITRAIIRELSGDDCSPVTSFSIDYKEKGVWKTAVNGTTIGKTFKVLILPKPITAKKFRLSIAAEGRPAITEFQLFETSGKDLAAK